MAEEVYLLSSYHLASTSSSAVAGPSVSQVDYPAQKQQKTQHKRLAVAAPGVGITVYDLLDQTPLSSLILGSSFRPTTAAVSRSAPTSSAESIRVKSIRRTWVGVESEGKGELWSWTEEEHKDGSVEGEASRVVHPTGEALASLAGPRGLPDHLVLLSSTGELSLAHATDFSTLATLPSSASTKPLSQSFTIHPLTQTSNIIPSSFSNLVPSSSKPQLAFVLRTFEALTSTVGGEDTSLVEISKKKLKKTKRPSSANVIEEAEAETKARTASGAVQVTTQTELELVLIDPEVELDGIPSIGLISLGSVLVPGTQAVVSQDGFVTCLSHAGALSSYEIVLSGHGSSVSSYHDLYTPSPASRSQISLTPLKSQPLSSLTLTASNLSLLALHSSFVILSSVQPAPSRSSQASSSTALALHEPTPTQITTLIWDVRLGAVVSETDLTIPNAALPTSSPPLTARLSLQSISKDAVALVVLPSTGTLGRSVVYVVPLSLPSSSVLAAVVGKQSLTKKYLAGGEDVAERARRTEPAPHPKASPEKLALLQSSKEARSMLLDELEVLLKPLEGGFGGSDVDEAIAKGEKLFDVFLSEERLRLSDYISQKLMAEEQRRIAAVMNTKARRSAKRLFDKLKRKIEPAIEAAGSSVPWEEVTKKPIEGVEDRHRTQYYDSRKKMEKSQEEARQQEAAFRLELETTARPAKEPSLPSSFVRAIIGLSFPLPLSSGVDISSSTTPSAKTWKHPTKIIAYLLGRGLVGDGLLEGGVSNHLLRAGDWPNLKLALENTPDIPETTTVALLKSVVSHHLSGPTDAIEVDPPSLPFTPPSLEGFLFSFVESRSTPALLRQALQQQLLATDVVPILAILDDWLGWWASKGGGGAQLVMEEPKDGKKSFKRLAYDPFAALARGAGVAGDRTPPGVDDILPLVQALLDAHFVNLLLQRQSHALLRRLAFHVKKHLALQADLANLLGALSIYARAKEEQKEHAIDVKVKKNKQGKAAPPTEKSKLEAGMAVRMAAQEKHADVLEYSVEKFWM